ncbi:MAG TPA: hypothetical protein VFC92_00915 [Bacteroidales bacterium]|nr:hypothetical protein [Bacteroidales bacterium]
MKKVLLIIALALFITTGVVTATEVQQATANDSELIVQADNNNDFASPFMDNDKTKKDAKKKDKNAKSATNCVKENCKETSCKEVCPDKSATKCCDESKTACNKDKGEK